MEAHLEFFDADEQRRLDVVARVGAAHTAGTPGKRAVLRRIRANLQPNTDKAWSSGQVLTQSLGVVFV